MLVSNTRLPEGHTFGASDASARVAPITAGSGSQSIAIASAASRARSIVLATTKATASPTWRTSSCARIGYGGALMVKPGPSPWPGHVHSVTLSGPVGTIDAPRSARALEVAVRGE